MNNLTDNSSIKFHNYSNNSQHLNNEIFYSQLKESYCIVFKKVKLIGKGSEIRFTNRYSHPDSHLEISRKKGSLKLDVNVVPYY